MFRILCISLILLLPFCSVSHVNRPALDAKTKVLKDKELITKISAYLDNPFKNFALINRAQWKLLRQITPGPILVDRLEFPEVGSITNFDSNAKMFLKLSRKNFIQRVVGIIRKSPDSAHLIFKDTKKILTLGIFNYIMRGNLCGLTGSDEIKLKTIIFKSVLLYGEIRAAVQLFSRFKVQLCFPPAISDESLIVAFLNELPEITADTFLKFQTHQAPAIFAFIINNPDSSLETLRNQLCHLGLVLAKTSLRASDSVSLQIIKIYENFLKSTRIPASSEAHNRAIVMVNWMRRSCGGDSFKYSFFNDMNLIRFQPLASVNPSFIDRILENWLTFSSYALFETIVIVFLRSESLILVSKAIQRASSVVFSSNFKETLREYPQIINFVNFPSLLKMHNNDLTETLKTVSLASGPPAALKILESFPPSEFKLLTALELLSVKQLAQLGFTFEQSVAVLRNVAAGKHNFESFNKWYTVFEALLLFLNQFKVPENYIGTRGILLDKDLFVNLLKSSNDQIQILKLVKNFSHFWRIEAAALAKIFEPKNEEIFKLLLTNKAEIVSLFAVNLLDLVPVADVSTWTDKICPLFHIDHRVQFFRMNDNLLPYNDSSLMSQIDSVIDGNTPILPYVNSLTAWTILPRLALRYTFQSEQTCGLLRLWARTCLTTFIVYAPSQHVRSILNRQAIVSKWLLRRPDDLSFNCSFAAVFLDDDQFSIELEAHSFDRFAEIMREIIPFLNSLRTSIRSQAKIHIYWKDVLSTISSVEQFKELIVLTSIHEIIQVFETHPDLKENFPYFYQLVYDFDFVCELI